MTRQLFLRTDPHELDRYEVRKIPRQHKFSQEKICNLDLLKRGLQALPPRELQMLYTDHVLRVGQEEASTLFSVRQSNMSYRLQRATLRIRLFSHLNTIISETELRKLLMKLGFPENHLRIILGVVKTTSQSATADAFSISQGSVRHIFSTALKRVASEYPDTAAYRLLQEVEKNYNQLRAIQTQRRWSWKVQGTNYAVDTPGESDDIGSDSWDDLCTCL
jgi:hypothetical protein